MTTPTLYKFVASKLHENHKSEIVDESGNLTFFDSDFQIMPKILKYDDDVDAFMNWLFQGLALEEESHDIHFKRTFLMRFINRQINRQTIEAFQMELMNVFLTNQDYINRVYQDTEKYVSQTSTGENTGNQKNHQENKQTNTSLNTQTDSRNTKDDTTARNNERSEQGDRQEVTGDTTTDNRQAHSELPQNTVNLNVDDFNMETANNADISRNKQRNNQTTDGTTTTDNRGESETESTGESVGESLSDTFGETEGETSGETDTRNESLNQSYRLDELFKTSGMMEGIFNTFDRKCFMQTW